MFSRIIKTAFFNFSIKVFSAVLILITQIVISRHYFLQELGSYSKLINYINIATVAGGLGLNVSAIFHLRKQLFTQTEVMRFSYCSYLVLSLVYFLLMLSAGIDFIIAILISVFAIMNNAFFLGNAIYQSQLNYRRFNLQHLLYAGTSVVAIVTVMLSNGKIDITNILLCQLVYLFLLVIFFPGNRLLKISSFTIVWTNYFKYVTYGRKIFLTNVMGMLLYSGDIIILDFLMDDAHLAPYLLAATAIKLIWLGIDSMGLIIYPELLSKDEFPKKILVASLNKIFLFLSGLLWVGLFVFFLVGRQLVEVIYGSEFEILYELLVLLIISTQGVLFYKMLSRFFAAIEKWTPIYLALGVGIAANWLFLFLLVPQYGITGAAYASIIAYFSTGSIIGIWYWILMKQFAIGTVGNGNN